MTQIIASNNPAPTPYRSGPFSRLEVDTTAYVMCRIGVKLNAVTEYDPIVFGGDDTGTMTRQSDLMISKVYHDHAAGLMRFAFSEESEKPEQLAGRIPRRVGQAQIMEYDEVDGTGDRKKAIGGKESASARGYTSLATFLENGVPVAGICVRPAHNELWIFSLDKGIELFSVSADGTQIEPVVFKRADRPNAQEIRVNFRPAYHPETSFPERVFELAGELSGRRYRYVPVEAGGAGDCFCRLLRGDLDLVQSGTRTDWKSWDTDLFSIALAKLNGMLTDYCGDPLATNKAYLDPDPWHTNGVLASLGIEADIHHHFQEAIMLCAKEYRADRKPSLFYDTRVEKR